METTSLSSSVANQRENARHHKLVVNALSAGFSGAQLANLVNEAALSAARTDMPAVSLTLLEDARDKILMGAQRKSLVQTLAARRLTAYHESGHALVALHTQGAF